jgi:ubiquinone biosynthesis protein
MTDVTGTLVKHRKRLNEIATVLVRHGLASWAARGQGLAGLEPVENLVHRVAAPEEAEATEGERLRGALTDLGTTFIKFGQMLSLRPDLVGEDTAEELSKLQATVPPDPPGVGQATVEAQLGKPVSELFGSFDAEPFASGSVAQVHRATLPEGTPLAVKVLHAGADTKVREDIELMRAIAEYVEEEDPELARLRPTVIVGEFNEMMDAAIDLRQELSNLQRFQANFANEPDVIIPTPYPDLSGDRVLTMALISGQPFSDRASVEAAGWDVDTLVHRTAEVYLEMIFRDGLYHADPHPGNFLLPDSTHFAILDFGDVGRVTSARKRQLEDMVIAVGTRDVDSLVDVVIEMTTPPPGVDIGQLRSSIELWLDRYLLVGVGRLDINAIVTHGMEILHRNKLVLPADLSLLFRVLIDLQGLGRAVGTDVRVTELLQPYISQMMVDRYNPKRLARQAGRSLRGWEHFISGLPEQLQSILDQVRTGNAAVDFRVHDADHAVDRLVDGLVTAASVVAGAELISRRASPMVGPFSVPGLVVAGVGVLTWQRLVARRGSRSWVSRVAGLINATRGSPSPG